MELSELRAFLKNRRVGLALGGGSARGWAHIGVVELLQEWGVEIHCVAGTSIGALVGGFAASDRIALLRDIAENLHWTRFLRLLDVTFPRSGLVDGKRIVDFVQEQIGSVRIEFLPRPFAAVAADLYSGRQVVLREGDLIQAIRASIAVPGVFTPVRRGKALLADGGLVNPVPVSVARSLGADFVVAVDLNHDIINHKAVGRKGWFGLRADQEAECDQPQIKDTRAARILERLNRALDALPLPSLKRGGANGTADVSDDLPNVVEVIMAAVVIMTARITDARLQVDRPDLLIRPRLGHINFLEFHRARESIEEGRRAAIEAIESFAP